MTTTVSLPAISDGRSFLFVPAHRPDRFGKARDSGADIVILDLEDAVPASEKEAARASAREWLEGGNQAVVRVNAAGTEWYAEDVRLAADVSAPVMLPKTETLEQISGFASVAPASPVIALVETSAGVLAASSICGASAVARIAFGSIDLAAQLEVDPQDRDALLLTRSLLVLASAAAGLAPPIDGVTTSFSNDDAVRSDVTYARRIGLTAKLCIHPAQVRPVHEALTPSREELLWAKKIVAASVERGGAVALEGHMIDPPVLARARRMLAIADPATSAT